MIDVSYVERCIIGLHQHIYMIGCVPRALIHLLLLCTKSVLAVSYCTLPYLFTLYKRWTYDEACSKELADKLGPRYQSFSTLRNSQKSKELATIENSNMHVY